MDGQTIITLAIIAGFILLFASLIVAFFVRRTVTATVASFSWSRKVFLEHYIWVQESSYSGFPTGSRNQHSQVESYQSYEFLRNETTTTQVNGQTTTTTRPVYSFVTRWRTKYSYEIQRWVNSRELQAEGKQRATLRWPSYTLNPDTQERVKKTQERYLVFFQTIKGKTYEQTMPESEWAFLDEKSSYTLKVNLFGQLREYTANTEQVAALPQQIS